MKKIGYILLAVFVSVMFASVAIAATSTSMSGPSCGPCAKQPCSSCMKCNSCAKPSCSMCARPCQPCKPACMDYKRDALGNKVPVYTNQAGDALNDKATGYENSLVTSN